MRLALWILALVAASGVSGAEAPRAPLTAGDHLQIKVAGEPDLTKEYTVEESGQVKMEMIGSIQAAGLTPGEFQAQLVKQLARYIRRPEVTLLAFQRVGVAGGVRAPGAYDFPKEQPIRLMDALMKAGGFGEQARKGKVLLVRRATRPGEPETRLVDVGRFLKKGKVEDNPVLGANDLIYVDVEEPRRPARGLAGLLEKALPLVGAFF
jgi:protein involved in polysaccharide export with SLBB domain